ncbi:hypothetical protein GCM10009645_51990 [Mycolicibacterium poriferae]|jgi:hypothetical protein|uniref:Uncharacterized protein n=1 Tax=Mycolicibacterium poriferae TaxID=39694 RepID=A0A6N4VC55_9MYCO|nr:MULTISPECIES: hypothetical protein [Mycolicibacterium]MCG7579178.1 hypothetical protein [Mycolicibacterium sp. OfavD-34-C]MCV7262856.1 hypothetical protein [Mycolicibacterium poriferae]BBX53352.1 hypothetical protein MPOR_43780 [Mycolicibacterium poriferae]
MAERATGSDDPFNETVATTGLFLLITAIIALAFALASWTMAETVIGAFAGAVALLSFVSSILCFKAQATEPTPAPAEVAA